MEEPEPVDYEKKIKDLEEELVRKDNIIENLRKEKELLFQTAMKNSERKLDTRVKKKVDK